MGRERLPFGPEAPNYRGNFLYYLTRLKSLFCPRVFRRWQPSKFEMEEVSRILAVNQLLDQFVRSLQELLL
jgi:hypothetical protein